MKRERFTVEENGYGGYAVWDNIKNRAVSECSHFRNADIIASRLMGYRDTDTPGEEWFKFYGVGD